MSQEITDLKVRNLKLFQENEHFKREIERLNARIAEWYQWSQSAQQTIKERDARIQELENSLKTFENRETKRQSDVGNLTIDQLYSQNQQWSIQLREIQEKFSNASEILFILLTGGDLQSQQKQIIRTLTESHEPTHKILATLHLRSKPATPADLVSETGLHNGDVSTALHKLKMRNFVIEIDRNLFVPKGKVEGGVSSDYSQISIEKVFLSVRQRIEVSSSPKKDAVILLDLKEALSRRGNSLLAYDITREVNAIKSLSRRDERRLYQLLDHWENEVKLAEQAQKVPSKKIDALSLKLMNTPDILHQFKESAMQLTSGEEMRELLSVFKDVLTTKGVSGLILHDMARTESDLKRGSLTKVSFIHKIDEWTRKLV